MAYTTKGLRAQQTEGRRVVTRAPGYVDAPVFCSPRNANDPKPWRLAGPLADNGYRYSGAECATLPPR